jgi:hypothetical protein
VKSRSALLSIALAGVGLVLAVVWLTRREPSAPLSSSDGSLAATVRTQPSDAKYVGHEVCAACHRAEFERWRDSDHALAMQLADASTIRGNFDNATFTYNGITSRFYRREGRYFVRTDGADGALHEYEIAYTFGIRPLQQYLVASGAIRVCGDCLHSLLSGSQSHRVTESQGHREKLSNVVDRPRELGGVLLNGYCG